jgi:hypothetical protein
MDRTTVLNASALAFGRCRQILTDIPDDRMLFRPTPESNPALWILGHLAASADSAAARMGAEPRFPKAFAPLFQRSSDPATLAATPNLPSRVELMSILTSAHEQIASRLPKVPAEALAQPHGVPFLADSPAKTVGDVLVHLLTTHLGFHTAQLSLIRRQLGHKPLL